MSRSLHIKNELAEIKTVEDLTQAFEGIASIHISHIRDRVVASKTFFNELWPVYRGLRVNPRERLRRPDREHKGRNVFVIVTGEGKLGTEVAEQIIDKAMSAHSSPQTTDFIAVGSRGASVLAQRGQPAAAHFVFPPGDLTLNVGDIIKELYKYDKISVFYQTYDSLRSQKIARIDLVSAVRELGQDADEEGEAITSADYIFEPSINEIADYMESVMMGVAFIQIIMESKLAGYATRFNTMSRAKKRAGDLVVDYKHQYHRVKRAESDERLKEIVKAARVQRAQL